MCEKTQEILTVEEMRQVLKIETNAAYNLIHSGVFTVIKIVKTYRIPAEPFYAWMENPDAAVH